MRGYASTLLAVASATPANRKLQETLLNDHSYSGDYAKGVYGDTLVFGDLIYLANADDRWELADADAEASAGDVMLAIALESGDDGDERLIFLKGYIRDDSWDFTSGGDALYVHTTAGDMSQTAPFGSSDIVRVVGHATADPNIIWFDPAGTWVEVA